MNKPIIMVVEDNQTTQETLKREFTACGFDVVLASTAEDAFLNLEKGLKCSFIILDFHFPGGEQGPDLYRRLGLSKDYHQIPIIPFTSQIESSSGNASDLLTDFSVALSIDENARDRSSIVSKGFSDNVERLPGSLYVAVGEKLRETGVRWPEGFKSKYREALAFLSREDN